jgi:hypothetical protein
MDGKHTLAKPSNKCQYGLLSNMHITKRKLGKVGGTVAKTRAQKH